MSQDQQIPAFVALAGLMVLQQAFFFLVLASTVILSALAYHHMYSPNPRA